jgi:hypothetical protein
MKCTVPIDPQVRLGLRQHCVNGSHLQLYASERGKFLAVNLAVLNP